MFRYCFLAFIVFDEKSAISFIFVPLYVMCFGFIFLAVFKIFCLSLVLVDFTWHD